MKVGALAASIAALTLSTSVAAVTVFDSASDFSSAQGAGGWYYGYYASPGDASSFTEFSIFVPDAHPSYGSWWAEATSPPPWSTLWASGGHPNGLNSGSEHWAVRRWISNFTGNVDITGGFQAADTGQTQVSVWLSGVELFQASTSASGGTFSLPALIANGSVLDFVISPLGEDISDSTTFYASAAAVPEPPSYIAFLVGFAILMGRVSIRRRLSSASS